MTTTGDLEISISDGAGASVVVPSQSVQAVFGCCSSGTANQPLATRSIATLIATLGYGELVEYCAMVIANGGTVIATKITQNAAGTGSAVTAFATGTSVVTLTLDGTVGAFDDYLVKFLVVTGGTRGTAGITFKLSLDAGRTYGPVIALGTATSYAIPHTGVTLAFAAGTMVAGESVQFSTISPDWATGGVQSAMNALAAGPYALTGWGSTVLLGKTSGSEATTLDGYLSTLASTYKVFARLIVCVRDVAIPVAWGGAGETEAAWVTAIEADYAACTAKRICAGAAWWNMPSAVANSAAGTPRYRRSVAWAAGVRAVKVPPQRHLGRVKDGALEAIVVDPTSDPLDGFVYHDERWNPGLTATKFMTTRTRPKKGLSPYIDQPNLMSASGSDFTLLPLGNVIDIAADIGYEVGVEEVNDDVRLNANGTIYENDARTIESAILAAINDNMTAAGMISSATVVVSRSQNVKTTSIAKISLAILSRGYLLEIDLDIAYVNTNAAAA